MVTLLWIMNGRRTAGFFPLPDDVPYFSFRGRGFEAVPCRVYDGDTFSSVFLYRGEWIKWRCRCLGYDSPEMKPPRLQPDREEEKSRAIQARDRFQELLTRTPSVWIRCGDFDKYGRLLVVVSSYPSSNITTNTTINDQMLAEGMGVPYCPRKGRFLYKMYSSRDGENSSSCGSP